GGSTSVLVLRSSKGILRGRLKKQFLRNPRRLPMDRKSTAPKALTRKEFIVLSVTLVGGAAIGCSSGDDGTGTGGSAGSSSGRGGSTGSAGQPGAGGSTGAAGQPGAGGSTG